MYHKEIHQNGCHITCEERDMGWGIDFSMRVTFPEWLNKAFMKSHQPMVRKIAQYTANKIELLLLTDATTYFDMAKVHGFNQDETNGLWVHYEGGKTAFIRPFIYQHKIDAYPFVSFNSVHEHGFTLTPGHYSDFILSESSLSDGRLFGYTKDFHLRHFGIASIYVLNFIENLETFLLQNNIPDDFEEFAIYHFLNNSKTGQQSTQAIEEKINELCSLNKSKRIDSLVVNNQSIYDYIHFYDIRSRFQLNSIILLNIALALGKPPAQVEAFIIKYTDKKNAIKASTSH